MRTRHLLTSQGAKQIMKKITLDAPVKQDALINSRLSDSQASLLLKFLSPGAGLALPFLSSHRIIYALQRGK